LPRALLLWRQPPAPTRDPLLLLSIVVLRSTPTLSIRRRTPDPVLRVTHVKRSLFTFGALLLVTVCDALFFALAFGVLVEDDNRAEDRPVELLELVGAVFGAVRGSLGQVQVALRVGDFL
jgi:hypothetical protein